MLSKHHLPVSAPSKVMQLLKDTAQEASKSCSVGEEEHLNDRHILVSSNQQTGDELDKHLETDASHFSPETKRVLLISVCFRFEPISLRPNWLNSQCYVKLLLNNFSAWYLTLLPFLREKLMKTLGSFPAHSIAICVTESKAALCSHTLALSIGAGGKNTAPILSAHMTLTNS